MVITEAKPPGDPGLPAVDPAYTIVAHSLSGTNFTLYEPWMHVRPLLDQLGAREPQCLRERRVGDPEAHGVRGHDRRQPAVARVCGRERGSRHGCRG